MPDRRLFVAFILIFATAAQSTGRGDPPSPASLREKLTAAIGESFDVLGGDVGAINSSSDWFNRPIYWFAKIRPKVAGEFLLVCTTDYSYDNDDTMPGTAVRGRITFPIKVGPRGAPRKLRPGSFGGSSWPHANVGDTIMVPIPLNTRRNHAFTTEPLDGRGEFFRILDDDRDHEKILARDAGGRLIRNDSVRRLKLLATLHDTSESITGKTTRHMIGAYVQLNRDEDFCVTAKLLDPPADEKSVVKPISLRVRPKDKPITVVLDHADCVDESANGATHVQSQQLTVGTLEARLGDRLLVECGQYETSEPAGTNSDVCLGVIATPPFELVETYGPADDR